MRKIKVAWIITGAGHFLKQSVKLVESLSEQYDIDIYMTNAAREVANMYQVTDLIKDTKCRLDFERSYSTVQCGKFTPGGYEALIIAPATSNSVSKFVLGISDSLASTMFAQAGKSGISTFVLPTDVKSEMESETPNGKKILVHVRSIDLKHTYDLEQMKDVHVARSPEELKEKINLFSMRAKN